MGFFYMKTKIIIMQNISKSNNHKNTNFPCIFHIIGYNGIAA